MSLEHKLGIHGSPTAVMNYGEDEGTVAYLVGDENRGLEYMFIMMNAARHAIGVEGYGIAPLEAMYARTPVVSFAVDALVEAIREGGWLVESGDYGGFAEAIQRFYDQPEERRRQDGEDARAYVLREYGWNTSASHYEELFQAVHRYGTLPSGSE